MPKLYPEKECVQCTELRKIAAKGLCRRCYGRLQRNGDFQSRRVKNICDVDGCDNPVISFGLCDKHRKRLDRHGHTEQTRASDWGQRESHPLYHSWGWIKRESEALGDWSDFAIFVAEVGAKPEGNYRLKRKDVSLDWSKENVHWVLFAEACDDPEEERQRQADQYRDWRKENPDKERDGYLKNRYGITLDHFNALNEAQEGLCAICLKEESAINRHTGEPRRLAVDHCHSTGKIRGLLCTGCNTALGGFKDDVELLQKAIHYLKCSKVE